MKAKTPNNFMKKAITKYFWISNLSTLCSSALCYYFHFLQPLVDLDPRGEMFFLKVSH
jgi:hypothetical protein